MSAPGTTPGPWQAERSVDLNGFETGKLWIVMNGQCCAYDFDRIEDATQAAAAPDLYDALKAMRDRWAIISGNLGGGATDDRLIAMADAALAKARGEARPRSPSPSW